MESINITELIQAIIYVLAAVISIFLIPLIKKKVGSENMAEFLKWVDIAVAAAEQLYDSAHGSAKKKYVLAYLEGKGFHVSETDLDLAIEAAVNRLHNELYGTGIIAEGLAAIPEAGAGGESHA